MVIEELYDIYLAQPSVQTDTRKLKEGDLFFALSGPSFNGNAFAHQALKLGASYCVCDDRSIGADPRFIFVDDVLSSLQQLARHHRMQFTIPFLAITGSNGKTTTKELIHAVLSRKFRCYTTEGNLNNHIGVPLTLLKIQSDAEIAIVEMGANHLKEIASYCRIALPNYGLITNCGKAHLEGFGSEENIKKGKGELFEAVKLNEGLIFVNEDLDYLLQLLGSYPKVIKYSPDAAMTKNEAAEFLECYVNDGGKKRLVKTQLVGAYNLPNAVAAVCIGEYFGVPIAQIVEALESYEPGNSRSQLLEYHNNKIVLDAYNANPSSMKLAIENFSRIDPEEKIVYLGSMKEMGEYSNTEHQALLSLLQQFSWKEVVLVGKEFADSFGDYKYFETTEAASEYFQKSNYNQEHILIKGSRGLALEKLLSTNI